MRTGASADRPVIVCLHGNLLKIRGRWRAVATLEALPRLFADPATDTDPEVPPQHQPTPADARARLAFRSVAAQFGWQACVVSPVMSRAGPWVAADVAAFVAAVALERLGSSKRVYLVGTSVGAFSALRVLQHLADRNGDDGSRSGSIDIDSSGLKSIRGSRSGTSTGSSSSSSSSSSGSIRFSSQGPSATWAAAKLHGSSPHGKQLFAAVALVSPGCGPMAGPLFTADPYCVMPHR